MSERLTITPAGGALGARVTGLSLANDLAADVLSAHVMAQIRQAWLDHLVLIFPDQPLTLEQQEAFTEKLGPFGEDPFIAPLEGHPHVLELRREPDEKAAHFGGGWHSDWSFRSEPPSATLLHSKIIPPHGGDTLFANGYLAYDALPDDIKKRVAGLKGIHSAQRPYSKQGLYANEPEKRSIKILPSDDALKTQTHPIVRVHPESGRKALFVNMVYTIGIEGLPEDEGQELLLFLCKHAVQDDFVYRHHWQENMLVMWDNRCTQHFADSGFDGYRRVLHRTTVAGQATA